MPCSDSSSSINMKLDNNEKFIHFEYAKITCGREINGETGLSSYYKGRRLEEILTISFSHVVRQLEVVSEESQFILYMEWDALRACIAEYLGLDDESIDRDRCAITSIEQTDEGFEVALVILPPKELPKILPCNLNEQ